MVRQKLVSNEDELVLSGVIVKRKQQFLLEYFLQGKSRKWQGYLLADSVPELTSQLINQVSLVSGSQYFSLALDAFTTAELSLMHSQQPDNLDVLKHLIERLIDEGNYDVASARIEQMLTFSFSQQHPIYNAYATWFKGQLLVKYEQYELAQNTLTQASSQMAEAEMLALQSEISKSLAEVAVYIKSYPKIQEYLFQSASQARLAKRPVQEIRAYTLLSIFSSKNAF